MSYIRPVRVSELTEFLIANGVDEEVAGPVAEALTNKYDVLTESASPR